jgi:hypothetical protein
MAHAHDIAMGGDEVEVAPRQETGLWLLAGFMVVAIARSNRPFFCQGGWAPSEVHGVVPAGRQCNVRKEMAGRDQGEVCLRGLLQGGVEGLEQACAAEVGERVGKPWRVCPDGRLVMTKASASARGGSSRRIGLRCAGLSRPGGCCRWGVIA